MILCIFTVAGHVQLTVNEYDVLQRYEEDCKLAEEVSSGKQSYKHSWIKNKRNRIESFDNFSIFFLFYHRKRWS